MSNYYGNRLVKFVSPQCDKMFCLELGGNEEELKDLIATILNILPNELKGIKDSRNNYYTFSSAIRNHHLTNTHSQYYTIVLSNSFEGHDNQVKRSSSLNINALSNNFNQAIEVNRRRKTDNRLLTNHQSFKQDQLLSQLLANKLLNSKDIEKIQIMLREEQNKDLIALFNNSNKYGLNILSKKALAFISNYNDPESNSHRYNPKYCYNNILLSIEDHFEDKKDMMILRKLLALDNEFIKTTLEEYCYNKNKVKLVDKLKQNVLRYKEKLNTKNSESVPSSVSSRRQNPNSKDAIINYNYNSIIKKLSFDYQAILEHIRSTFNNFFQLFELDKNFFNSNNENISINLIKKYCNEFIHKNLFAYFTQDEIRIYSLIVNDVDNNKNIIKAFELFRTKGFNVNELRDNIKEIIQNMLLQEKEMKKKPESKSYKHKSIQSHNLKSQRNRINVKTNPKLNNNKTDRKEVKDSSESNEMKEFIKAIQSFPFEENNKSILMSLISDKDYKMMRIFENYQKNKMSLTKNILLQIIRHNSTSTSKTNYTNNNNNPISSISNNDNLKNVPDSSSEFNDVIAYFEQQKIISLGESGLIKKRYQNNDEMLLSFWEVFKQSDNELLDFIESLKTFISKHHEKNTNSPEPVGSKTPISITNTKKDLIYLFHSKERKATNIIKNKQKRIVDLLLTEKLIEKNTEEFFKMKIDETDPMISSVFEVFSVTRDHRDFIQSLNIIKEIMYNKDNNSTGSNNDTLTNSMNALNSLLQKSDFNDNDKELLRSGMRQNNQTILSAIEVYEKEKDVDEALDTLEIIVKKSQNERDDCKF